MTQLDAVQAELKCSNCGGQCTFEPASGGLVCESCGTKRSLEAPWNAQAAREFDYEDSAQRELPVIAETRVHNCQNCGGSVIFTGPSLSDRCAYCDGPVVLGNQDAAYQTTALIPFQIAQDEAQSLALAWIASRIGAPSDLLQTASTGRVAGLYAPFWTFDSQEAVRYWARYTTGHGDRRRTKNISGRMKIAFDDMLVPASHHVTPLIRDGILHDFDPGQLRPYRPAYLSGFAAERHHQSVDEGLLSNAADKDVLIRNRIKHRIAKRNVRGIGYRTDTTGIKYRRILLPVWILHYEYNAQPYKVVVCGIRGRTFGERPFSRWKVLGFAALASAATIGFGLVWGAGWALGG